MLGLLGLRIFEACAADIADLGEEHGHRVLRVVGKGTKVVLVPLPPAVARAIDRAVDGREDGPLLRNRRGARMDRHAGTRRLRHLAATAGVRLPEPPPKRGDLAVTGLRRLRSPAHMARATRHASTSAFSVTMRSHGPPSLSVSAWSLHLTASRYR
jgi:integrase